MNSNIKMPSCIILAAGLSSRMEYPKPFLEYSGEITFLENLIQVYFATGIHQIIIVGNSFFTTDAIRFRFLLPGHCRLVVNPHPEYGRFYSLQLGLKETTNGIPVFIQNIDNPFVTPVLLKSLLENLGNSDSVVPQFNGTKGHPVLLGRRIAGEIKQMPDHNRNLRDILINSHTIQVNDPRILVNINTMKDYITWFPVTKFLPDQQSVPYLYCL